MYIFNYVLPYLIQFVNDIIGLMCTYADDFARVNDSCADYDLVGTLPCYRTRRVLVSKLDACHDWYNFVFGI